MIYKTLVDVKTLHANLNNPDWIVIDCRFSLAQPDLGGFLYRHGHIPNARYAHLNNDLSSPITSQTGRHPLPNFEQLAQKIGAWGIKNSSQVIVYDDANGAFAARLWWLLRYLGHENVAVLDGGIGQWRVAGYELTTVLPKWTSEQFEIRQSCGAWLTAAQVETELAKKAIRLIDARTPERYRGEQEPIDPVAGHIPYALNRPFQHNLTASGLFLSSEKLREQFLKLLGNFESSQTVHYCGSGVTACHNLLAMEHAELSGSKLYAGSWSEWIVNKNRCVAR